MKNRTKEYFTKLKSMFDEVIALGSDGKQYKFEEAIEMTINLITQQSKLANKLIFIGNGASAAISSHVSVDFWKNRGIKAIAFNDSSLLTCISNDYGYNHVFEKPIEMFGHKGDVLFAISSSGKSENILRAVDIAKKKDIKVITLSGFDKDNPLRKIGDLNFYVPISQYGIVEIIHHSICHCLIDNAIIDK